MTSTIRIRVVGLPAPQGSKRFVGLTKKGRGVMIESSKQVKPWRESVVAAALEQTTQDQRGLDEPVELDVEFILAAPTSASKKKLAMGPCRKPDLSKLVRSTEDAITTAGIWADDGRVVSLGATKRYACAGEALGADIRIRRLP